MSDGYVDIARRGWAAIERGDLQTIEELLDDNVTWHAGDPNAEGACRGRDQVLEFMRRGREAGVRAELVDIRSAGDRVVLILRRSESEPLAANVTTFVDGKVVEMVHFDDPAAALRACGIAETNRTSS